MATGAAGIPRYLDAVSQDQHSLSFLRGHLSKANTRYMVCSMLRSVLGSQEDFDTSSCPLVLIAAAIPGCFAGHCFRLDVPSPGGGHYMPFTK